MTTEVAVGPSLDAAIAKKVMGWKPQGVQSSVVWRRTYPSLESHWWLFKPSESIEHAFQVEERMRELGWRLVLDLCFTPTATFYEMAKAEMEPISAFGDTPMAAICFGALEVCAEIAAVESRDA